MTTRLVGVELEAPRLPQTVITASQGDTADDLAPGDTLALAALYTDDQVSERLPLSGGELTGPLILPGVPSAADEAATKQYVDDAVAAGGGGGGPYLPLTGGALSGRLTLNNNADLMLNSAPFNTINFAAQGAITGHPGGMQVDAQGAGKSIAFSTNNVQRLGIGDTSISATVPVALPGAPTSPLHAATKQYVDDVAAGGGGGTFVLRAGDTMTGQLIVNGADVAARQTTTSDVRGFYVQNSAGGGIGSLTHDRTTMKLTNAFAGSALEISTASAGALLLRTSTTTRLTITDTLITTSLPVKLVDAASANVLWLVGGPNAGGVNATIIGRNQADSTSVGRLSFYETQGVALASMVAAQPVKLVVDNADKLTVGSALTTSASPIALPADPASALHAATKQYVDVATARRAQARTDAAGVSIPNGTNTIITLTAVDFDTPGWRSGNVFTPNIPGWYRVTIAYEWASATATRRLVELYKNGAVMVNPVMRDDIGSQVVPTGVLTGAFALPLVQMNGTSDTLSVNVFQTTNPAAAANIKLRVLVEYVPT